MRKTREKAMSIKGKIIKNGNVILDVHETALLDVEGELITNHNLPKGSTQECIIRLYRNAELHIKGKFYLNYGTTIQVFEGGKLTLGSGAFNSNTVVGVSHEMIVGEDFLGGRNLFLYDSDFHDIWVEQQKQMKSETVRIGNHVWLGAGVTVLKGVTIGDGVIVGASSVVTSDIMPECMAVGNPARIIKRNVNWKF